MRQGQYFLWSCFSGGYSGEMTYLWNCNVALLGQLLFGLFGRIRVGEVGVEVFVKDLGGLLAEVSALAPRIQKSWSEDHHRLASALLQLNLWIIYALVLMHRILKKRTLGIAGARQQLDKCSYFFASITFDSSCTSSKVLWHLTA